VRFGQQIWHVETYIETSIFSTQTVEQKMSVDLQV
jgi:hypothetical protein